MSALRVSVPGREVYAPAGCVRVVRGGERATVYPEVREAVRYAAERVPVAIVSGAALEEIQPVVEAAGLEIPVIVAADHVVDGKPHPEGYLIAARTLGVEPHDVLAFEDTEAGVASAKAAGMRVVAITRTLGAERLAEADELIAALDLATIQRLLA